MNKMMIIGNLTRDPELRTTPQGVSVCDFTVAVNRRGKEQPVTDFFRVTAWRQLGDNCQKYLAQGRKVYVAGPLTAKTYQSKDGATKIELGITAEDVEFLTGREEQKPVAMAPSSFMQVDDEEVPF